MLLNFLASAKNYCILRFRNTAIFYKKLTGSLINEEEIINTLKNKDLKMKLVTDKDNKNNLQGIKTVRNYNTQQLMHNKFF